MMEKIVFIAHSYHKKTRSYDFIVDYLKQYYDVELLFDEQWETGNEIDWSLFDNSYKAVIIFQMFPETENLKKITNDNIVYLPMFDHVEKWHFKKWYECKNIKIVSFSSTLHKKLTNWGFNSIYVQFFVEPKEFTPGNENEVFFWQRFTKININTIKKIFKKSNVKIHIHKAIDPGQEFVAPTKEDEEKFAITYSEWFDTKKEMMDLINARGIYIAPRYTEGIGTSFLEAMAQGKLVIAHNKPTMNEYITNGKTGLLCNFKFPKSVNLKDIKKIQQNTYEYAKAGYEKWLVDRANIIEFIKATPTKTKLKISTRILLPFLFFDPKKIIRFKCGKHASLILFGIKIFEF